MDGDEEKLMANQASDFFFQKYRPSAHDPNSEYMFMAAVKTAKKPGRADVTHNSEFSGTPAWTTLASSPDLKCELPLFPGLTDLTTHIFHWRFVQSGPVWLYQSLGILTDCLRTAEFSQNKHPLAISFLESPTHVCSTNRPHWDGIPVFTSASSDAPARKQAHLQIF